MRSFMSLQSRKPEGNVPRGFTIIELACSLAIVSIIALVATSVYSSLLKSLTKTRMSAGLSQRAQSVVTFLSREAAVIGGADLPAQFALSVDNDSCVAVGAIPACDAGTDRLSWLEVDISVPAGIIAAITATSITGQSGAACSLSGFYANRFVALMKGNAVALVDAGNFAGCDLSIACVPFGLNDCTNLDAFVGGTAMVVNRKALFQADHDLMLTFFNRPPLDIPAAMADPMIVSRSVFDFQVAVGLLPADQTQPLIESASGAGDSWIFNSPGETLSVAGRNRSSAIQFDIVVGVPVRFRELASVTNARGNTITERGVRMTAVRGRVALRNRLF